MVTIEQVKNVCDELIGKCSACPFASKEGCPFLSDDPFDWDVDYINERYVNSPFNKVENSDSAQHDKVQNENSKQKKEDVHGDSSYCRCGYFINASGMLCSLRQRACSRVDIREKNSGQEKIITVQKQNFDSTRGNEFG